MCWVGRDGWWQVAFSDGRWMHVWRGMCVSVSGVYMHCPKHCEMIWKKKWMFVRRLLALNFFFSFYDYPIYFCVGRWHTEREWHSGRNWQEMSAPVVCIVIMIAAIACLKMSFFSVGVTWEKLGGGSKEGLRVGRRRGDCLWDELVVYWIFFVFTKGSKWILWHQIHSRPMTPVLRVAQWRYCVLLRCKQCFESRSFLLHIAAQATESISYCYLQ